MNPRTFIAKLPKCGFDDSQISERWYPGVRDAWRSASSSRTVDPIYGIEGLVIHATAGANSAGAVSVITVDQRASFHWLVPGEKEAAHGEFVWACIPEVRAAWHVRNACSNPDVNGGKNMVNHWTLGIEIVNEQTATDTFSDWQVQATAQIARYCWAKYPNFHWIVSHAALDPTRRSDPGSLFPWERFMSLVRGEL